MNAEKAPAPLRDRLAIDRTALANERTLLAYARTALMLIASGATLWRLGPPELIDRGLGAAAAIAGIAVLVIGIVRFASQRRRLLHDTDGN